MPSYRFCRPDDLALIVHAINTCYNVHDAAAIPMTQERLKEHMTLFAVRPGNCVVALEQHQPVGVVVSTKRDTGAWLQALGCQAAFQRRGIAAQLVEALIRKIAIQHVPRLTVDVPTDRHPAVHFFEALAFTIQGRYVSYQGVLPAPSLPQAIETMPAPEILDAYAHYHTTEACWERSAASLAAYGTLPLGYVYRAQGAVQGYLLHLGETILDLALAPQAASLEVVTALLGRMQAAGHAQAVLPKVPDHDPLHAVLPCLGFTAVREFLWMGRNLQEPRHATG